MTAQETPRNPRLARTEQREPAALARDRLAEVDATDDYGTSVNSSPSERFVVFTAGGSR